MDFTIVGCCSVCKIANYRAYIELLNFMLTQLHAYLLDQNLFTHWVMEVRGTAPNIHAHQGIVHLVPLVVAGCEWLIRKLGICFNKKCTCCGIQNFTATSSDSLSLNTRHSKMTDAGCEVMSVWWRFAELVLRRGPKTTGVIRIVCSNFLQLLLERGI